MRFRAKALIFIACLLPATVAHAAGMFLAPRGIRPLARGGAFVAGADDVNALSYNPAGIAYAGSAMLLDVGYPLHTTEYRRQVFADSEPLPEVQGNGMGMPIPTLGFVYALTSVPLSLGLSAGAPFPLLQNWPRELDNGSPAPQRYAIHNYQGTAMAEIAGGAAYRVTDKLALGLTVNLLVGTFAAELTASNCDGAICTQAENPDYDAVIQMSAQGIVTPGVQLGLIYDVTPSVRIGAAWKSGYKINQEADLRVRLPRAAMYDNASIDPEDPKGKVKLKLPMEMRLGVEVMPVDWARVELALVYERWSAHDKIDVDASGVTVRNVVALGDYPLGTMAVERNFRDSFAVRLGSEIELVPVAAGLWLRGGLAYERSAVAPASLTAMNVDLDKVFVALGLAYEMGELTLEATYAHIFMPTTTVTDGTIRQTNGSRPPWEGRTPIGNGTYASRADIVGIGVTYGF